MTSTRPKGIRLIAAALLFLSSYGVAAQTTVSPGREFWPKLQVNFDLPDRNRIQVFVAKEDGDDFGFDEFKTGATFSRRMKRIVKGLRDDANAENEYNLVLGIGYEYVRTNQSGSVKNENRILVEATPRHAPGAGFLITDRNRAEFRWVDGKYDFRYRNKLTVDRPFKIRKLKLTPYVAGELFWDRNHHAWNENQITVGAQWSHRLFLMLDLYYLRQNCTTCNRDPLNVAGVTVNLYFPGTKK